MLIKIMLLLLTVFPLSNVLAQYSAPDYSNGQIVKWIYTPESISAADVSSRLLNLASYDDQTPPSSAPADSHGYFVFRHVQRNTAVGNMTIPNATDVGQYTGLPVAGDPSPYQRALTSTPGVGDSAAQSYGGRFGAMINMWGVNPHTTPVDDGGPQGQFEVKFQGAVADLPSPWTTFTSALTLQASTNVPWINFGGNSNCNTLTPASADLSWGLLLRDKTSPDSAARFVSYGVTLYDSRPVSCPSSVTIEGVDPTPHYNGTSIQMRVSAILKPSSIYVDTSPYVSDTCKTAKYGTYDGECWIRIHIPGSKLIAALTEINSKLGTPCGTTNAYSCSPADYVLGSAQLALEVYNVTGFPYDSNSLSVGYMLGDIYVFEMN